MLSVSVFIVDIILVVRNTVLAKLCIPFVSVFIVLHLFFGILFWRELVLCITSVSVFVVFGRS